MKYRREMNTQDREANARAIDTLLNFETVKYFGNERHELDRFDEAKQDYVTAAIANQRSLSLFNIGQSSILSLGVIIVMMLAGYGVVQGRMTHRRFRHGERLSASALSAAEHALLGLARSCARPSPTSSRCTRCWRRIPRCRTNRTRPRFAPDRGAMVFDHVNFAYDPRRPILQRCQLRGSRRAYACHRRTHRRRQIHHRAAAVPLLRSARRAPS